ncbi:MAG: antirestriction protein ArdA [Moorea sp. SIO3C2]|nr:antirestriction protein ArdA [Moorena sp. SIO3C2]
MPEAKIYVACLASYNAGQLHGEWIDCDQDSDSIMEEIQEMLKRSPQPNAEEWAIHGTEGFGDWTPSNLGQASMAAEMMSDHGEAAIAWIENYAHDGLDPSEWNDRFQDQYYGEHESEKAFAEDLIESLEETLSETTITYGTAWSYLDFEAIARDLFICDYTSYDSSGGIYVFSNHR